MVALLESGLGEVALVAMQKLGLETKVCIVKASRTAAQVIARAPLRTIRAADLAEVYAHPGPELSALERRGLVHRLAHGLYCGVPPEHEPSMWRPTIEAAAAGIATALYGDRVPVLTGLTAARVHQALPRAIAIGFVAVPSQRRPLRLADRDGEVRFVTRAVADLDAVLVTTDLGPALATTPEQTILDLARSDPRGRDIDAQEAIAALWPGCDPRLLDDIATRQRMRTTLARLTAQQ